MDLINILRQVKMYNKEVEHFLFSRRFFQNDEITKKDLLLRGEKLKIIVKKSFPLSEPHLIVANVHKKFFGKNDNDEIITLLNCKTNVKIHNDDEIDFFLSDEYKKTVF